ncbi:folate family ECF transporter S component [Candidatus Xianfuyuplasma coldseepsis]|uniref:Folate family ECF transporter S component n=1 Tax=Candidatus Xianfuyuplasma coldseepsis TaxID=2782163 RepID=A0A7L7KQ08_9MOLU|nr:folate family ECF transporter S component [Xianfuyuplasma coldseepsis]QMS84276.1 folate family ECF transporter S component [Xianfuyuplasma coldseepsis]
MFKVPRFTTRGITLAASFVAMAIILKSLLVIETGNLRITMYEIPMVFIGVTFGPIVGGLLGFVVDFVHILFSPWAYTFNVFTVSNMLWGIIPGLFFFQRPIKRTPLIICLVVTGVLTFGLNSYGIYQYEGMGSLLATLPYRVGLLVIKVPLQVYLIEQLYDRVVEPHLKLQKA